MTNNQRGFRTFLSGVRTLSVGAGVLLTLAHSSEAAAPKKKPRSQEWRDLPTQKWEPAPVTIPESVDAQGFDLRARYVFPKTQGFELPWLAASEPMNTLGTITASRSEGKFLSSHDEIYIRAESGLQKDKLYAITTEPGLLKASLFGRKGLAYPILGTVRITDQKDGLWIGRIENATAAIERSSSVLIENPGRVRPGTPIPAPSAIEATFLNERGHDVKFSAQFKLGFIDRGTSDGISTGMLLRSFQKTDPHTSKDFGSDTSSVASDVLVLQTSERFSTVMVLRSLQQTIDHGTSLVALTDVSDLGPTKLQSRPQSILIPETNPITEPQTAPAPEPSPTPTEDLDALHDGKDLTDAEKKDLDQLEKQPTPVPSVSPTPEPSSSESPMPEPSPSATPTPESELPTPSPEVTPAPEPSATAAPVEEVAPGADDLPEVSQ